MDKSGKIFLWANLKRHLSEACRDSPSAVTGMLFGCRGDGLHILSAAKCQQADFSDMYKESDTILKYLPAGVELCGIFLRVSQVNVPQVLLMVLQKVVSPDMQKVFAKHPVLIYAVDPTDDGTELPAFYWFSDKLEPATVSMTADSILDSFLSVRLHASIPFNVQFNKDNGDGACTAAVKTQISILEDDLVSNASAFRIQHSSVILQRISSDAVKCSGVAEDCSMLKLLDSIRNEEGFQDKKKGRAISNEVVHVKLLKQVSGDIAVQRSIECAPIIHHEHENFQSVTGTLPLDVVVPVPGDMPVRSLPTLLLEGACRQLQQMQICLTKYSSESQLCVVKPLHFKPAALGHLLNVVWPENADESVQNNIRNALHGVFLLSKNCPVFRACLSYRFPDEPLPGGYLQNTHIGLPPSGVEGGKVSCVQGTYSYHHYMQDRMDDNGWGCAYRSLQTLISWFRHQGYTEKPVPTHQQIQQTLVDIGDKEPKFAGSRQWIGSTECSFVLDEMFNVSCKILYVSNGAEMSCKGRELAMHFQTQGTPIMIGGGVLAHTILGVDFNDVTGDVKFLILDPHYTGAEDIKVIQDKGWCGWKTIDFWDKLAYYNLCMPQRPSSL